MKTEEDEAIEQVELTRDSERKQLLGMDNRGRITIPSTVRGKYDIDPTSDEIKYRVDVTIERIEAVPRESDEEGSA